jgi:hypothetical protein
MKPRDTFHPSFKGQSNVGHEASSWPDIDLQPLSAIRLAPANHIPNRRPIGTQAERAAMQPGPDDVEWHYCRNRWLG